MNTCQDCIHFHQHYVLDEQSCTAVVCGHCAHPRLKHRRPDAAACAHFEARTAPPPLPDRKKVVHYLTREFLEYVLSLELPPEVRGQ